MAISWFGLRPNGRLLLASMILGANWILAPQASAATAQLEGITQGATPFNALVRAAYAGASIASVGYIVQPQSGSVTRPLVTIYPAQYLSKLNYFVNGNEIIVPVFGLYAGATNTVYVYYFFTDGTSSVQTTTISTPTYTDPCPQVNARFFAQSRASTNSLNFDYFLLKDFCGTNSPALFDTDGNIRWVGTIATPTPTTAFWFGSVIYSDGKTGVNRIEMANGQITQIADYANIGVTLTGHHNADYGRNGLIFDVDTTTQTEAVDIEIDPNTGAVLNQWDLGAIISAAMTAGGDDPSRFVLGTTADWFHNNASTYNPADNTLIVSSRENFVIAVDYDPPASGQRKIHWILGDTTKAWAQFPSLAKFALKPGNATTLLPIGQHAVSIDHNGNLLLFDDGLGSLTQNPPGLTRSYSAARAYKIDQSARTATEVFTYSLGLLSPICSSVYDVNGHYLVDYTTANNAAMAAAQAKQTNGAIVNTLFTGSGTWTLVVGLGDANQQEFGMAIPAAAAACGTGWNAVPFTANVVSVY